MRERLDRLLELRLEKRDVALDSGDVAVVEERREELGCWGCCCDGDEENAVRKRRRELRGWSWSLDVEGIVAVVFRVSLVDGDSDIKVQ